MFHRNAIACLIIALASSLGGCAADPDPADDEEVAEQDEALRVRVVAKVKSGVVVLDLGTRKIPLRAGSQLRDDHAVRVPRGKVGYIQCLSNGITFPLPNDDIPRPVVNFCG